MISAEIYPLKITLHQLSRQLEVNFNDGALFYLPAEYLRVHSPSAEVQGHHPSQAVLVTGKRDIGIVKIEQVGHYAVKIFFDDGHASGIYTWEILYDLGKHQKSYWQTYLARLQAVNASRDMGNMENKRMDKLCNKKS